MTDEDRMKVEKFKKEFEPKNLPDEIFQSGRYHTGSDTNRPYSLNAFNQAHVNYQGGGINPQYAQMSGVYGQSVDVMGGLGQASL